MQRPSRLLWVARAFLRCAYRWLRGVVANIGPVAGWAWWLAGSFIEGRLHALHHVGRRRGTREDLLHAGQML